MESSRGDFNIEQGTSNIQRRSFLGSYLWRWKSDSLKRGFGG
ncbi:MAG TPA: hypothetical protein VFM80_07735 [Gracilimonas sp.]|nr:hypothetical protein [Gracilimonas sp.]